MSTKFCLSTTVQIFFINLLPEFIFSELSKFQWTSGCRSFAFILPTLQKWLEVKQIIIRIWVSTFLIFFDFWNETSLGWFAGEWNGNVKVNPHYATLPNATKCGLAVWPMAKIMWMSMRRGLGRASACCGMKIRSAKCWSH